MKKFLICALAFFCACWVALSFDWQHQENDALRSDMLTFAEEFASRAGCRERRILKRFIREQKRQAATRPYAWIADTKDVVLRLEELCPPVEDDGSKAAELRRDILLLLDYPLHADNRDKSAPEGLKQAFTLTSETYRAQGREKALEILAKPGPSEPGRLQVIKIYNSGMILRTSEHTVAVDILWEGDEDGAAVIASKIDAFFLSHPHKDHYSDVMIKALASADKPAVLPSDVAPPGVNWNGKRVIFEDCLEPFVVSGIKVNIVTGYQHKLPNNAYLLDFDGWRILLPGENDQHKRYETFTALQAPDLILEPTWNRVDKTFDIVSRMGGYNRDAVFFIPSHENELSHPVNHRESYRELFSRPDRLGNPSTKYPRVFLLDIGESVILEK